MAAWLHANPVETIVGRIRFDPRGDWDPARVLMVQFRGLKGRNVEQFREAGRQVIVDPPGLESGDYVPFDKARA